jgi:hypothetical protein
VWVGASGARGESKGKGRTEVHDPVVGVARYICGMWVCSLLVLGGEGGWVGCNADEDGDEPGSVFVSGEWSGREGLDGDLRGFVSVC